MSRPEQKKVWVAPKLEQLDIAAATQKPGAWPLEEQYNIGQSANS